MLLDGNDSSIYVKVGQMVLHIENKRMGKLVGFRFCPNGVDDPSLVCIFKVEFYGGSHFYATSEHFRAVPEEKYEEFKMIF